MAAPEDVQNLRAAVMRYKAADDQIRELNKQVYPLREQRKIIEMEIVDIVKQPAYAAFTKLDIREDGSSIKIIKPGWNAAWSLSKTSLRYYLTQYFQSTGAPTADGCYRYIHDIHLATLRKNEYAIERVVPSADE